ncbi:MAG TPA: hypothetical protein VIZ28_06075, partial [Chitinophagaceae bacterium]
MKRINSLAAILLIVLYACIPDNIQAQDRSYYTLGIKNIAPANITFTNNSNLEVKVILYNPGDEVMAVGLTSFNIKPGDSKNYKNGVYNVKIFKPAILDKLLFTQKNVSGNLVMSGKESKFSAERKSSRKNTEFINNTGEKIKICIYKRNDNLKTIPVASYDLKDNTSTAIYNGDLSSFFVSVFQPGVIDRLLLS